MENRTQNFAAFRCFFIQRFDQGASLKIEQIKSRDNLKNKRANWIWEKIANSKISYLWRCACYV